MRRNKQPQAGGGWNCGGPGSAPGCVGQILPADPGQVNGDERDQKDVGEKVFGECEADEVDEWLREAGN